MHTLLKKQVIAAIALLICLAAKGVSANSFEILVTDSSGRPLQDAVVELASPRKSMIAPSAPLVVDQVDKSFVPKVLVAPVDSLVNFPNSDQIRHHVYSFSEAKTFELKLYADQPKAPILFDKAGVVVLGCNIHDSMVGYIYVAGFYAARTDKEGIARFNIPASAISSFTVWHPYAEKGVTFRKQVTLSKTPSRPVTVAISITPPEPRNTFEDVFGYH